MLPCTAALFTFKELSTYQQSQFGVICALILWTLQVEEMDNSGHWLPNHDLLWQCGQIFLAEVAIDVAKHAVVGKFNEIRPGVYREFMKVSTLPSFIHMLPAYLDQTRWSPTDTFDNAGAAHDCICLHGLQ